jgi:predicted ATP-dependent Lon-type protease
MRIRVKYLNLGKHKVWGFSDSAGHVELDKTLKGKKHLEILIHECLHLLYPDSEEEEIIKNSVTLTNTLWHEKYRRVDDKEGIPMQDGTL